MPLPYDTNHDSSATPRPPLYDNVFWFSGKRLGPGIASIGGTWRTPNYELSYLLAARQLLERSIAANEEDLVAVPVAFLQRHGLELGLKVVIDAALGNKHDERRIAAIETGTAAAGGPPPTASQVHSLECLVLEAQEALRAVGHELPNEIVELSNEFHLTEGGIHTRWRYDRIVDKGQKKESLDEKTILNLLERQQRLERVFEQHLVYRPDAAQRLPNGLNLVESLAIEGEAQFQRLFQLGDEV